VKHDLGQRTYRGALRLHEDRYRILHQSLLRRKDQGSNLLKKILFFSNLNSARNLQLQSFSQKDWILFFKESAKRSFINYFYYNYG